MIMTDKNYGSEFATVLVDKEFADLIIENCVNRNLKCTKEKLATVSSFDFELISVLISFLFFLMVSVVLYAFSGKKDVMVKKSLGYSVTGICLSQFKSFCKNIILITLILFVVSLVVFSVIFGFVSSVIFNALIILLFLVLMLFFYFCLIAAYLYLCYTSRISDIKGKSCKKDFMFLTELFSVIILLLFLNTLSQIDLFTAVSDYARVNKIHSEYEHYFTFRLRNLETYDSDAEKYSGKIVDIYRQLHKNNLILADEADSSLFGDIVIRVNDNYVNFCDNLSTPDGEKITSEMLISGKHNYLVPENYETEYFEYIRSRSPDKYNLINIIYYSPESDFFLFSNSINGKRIKNAIIDIWDVDYAVTEESEYTVYMTLTSFFSYAFFMKYDDAFSSPYNQIKSVFTDNKMESIILAAPFVNDIFAEYFIEVKSNLLKLFYISVIYSFAFITLLVFSAELYSSCYLRDIAVKITSGQSMAEIMNFRLIIILSLIPLELTADRLGILEGILKINDILMITAVLLVIIVYYVTAKRKSLKKIYSILKGA